MAGRGNSTDTNEFLAITALSSGTFRVEKLSGVEYIVVPVVALVEGVLQGVTADQPELALASEFARFPMAWNGRPITIDHPYLTGDDGEITRVSASTSPDVLENFQVGFIFNTTLDNTGDLPKLRMEAWIDPVKAHNHSDAARQLLAKVRKGEIIEVSTGLFTGSEKATGTYGERQYFGVWRGVVPDHLALLPDGLIGACSNADGCGVYANASQIKVHRLQTSCSCGGSCMSVQPTQSSSTGALTVPPGASPPVTPTGNAAFSFKADDFLANMIPDGMLDQDVRTLLQNEIADAWPGAYAYLVGFTAQKAIFSMYDSIDGDRDTYQVSYSIDSTSKEVDLGDDLSCVVLTTEITEMPDDDDSSTYPRSLMDFSADNMKAKKKPKASKAKAKVKKETDDPSEVSGYSAYPLTTTENPMTSNSTVVPGTPATLTANAAREFLVDFGWDATTLKTVKDEDVFKAHAKITAGLTKHAPKPTEPTATSVPAATTQTAVAANSTAQDGTPKVLTQEEYLAAAPPGVRESIEQGLRMHAQFKKGLITKIMANSRNKFTEQQLGSFDSQTLENLADLAVVPDYSGIAPAGGGIHAHTQTITTNEADLPYAAAPPRLATTSNADTPRGVTKAA